jgi:hypothetical protein
MSMKLPGLGGGPLASVRAVVRALEPGAFAPRSEPPTPHAVERKRRRIWDLSGGFHCSIVGTCLTTGELRSILVKIALPGVDKETDHELHGRAVLLAGRREPASKLLQKALDRRHRAAIALFNRARTAGELGSLWEAAVQRADIPGAYWAVLTHPEATESLVRQVFGEVHMLSHLVGAANRADIRRLRQLEGENTALQDKVARQQRQLRDAVVSRDARIAELSSALARGIASRQSFASTSQSPDHPERTATSAVVADLRGRLAAELAGRERVGRRVQTLTAERDWERRQRQALERREGELRRDLEAAEIAMARLLAGPEPDDAAPRDMAGRALLYVGGRKHQVAALRKLAEQANAAFLHHDGGIDDRSGLLEALVARADVTLFPVDCVSHNAVIVVKRTARISGKPFIPLRSSGLASFAAALRSIAEGPSGTGARLPRADAVGAASAAV